MVLRIRPARLAWKSKKANCRVQERGVEILHWRSRGTGQGRAGQGRGGGHANSDVRGRRMGGGEEGG